MSALQAIDQNAFKKRVADHITNTFGALIPEEQFQSMVDAQVKEFFETTREFRVSERQEQNKGGYGTHTVYCLNEHITPFQHMVFSILRDKIESALVTHLNAKDSPISKLLRDLVEVPVVGEIQLTVAQKVLLQMAGKMFAQVTEAAGHDARQQIARVFIQNNMPDIGFKIQNGD